MSNVFLNLAVAGDFTDVITNIGVFFNKAVLWVQTLATQIANSPILLIMVVALPVAGISFGYLRRLIHT